MSVIFVMVQQRFEQAFLEQRWCPTTVTIAEADYKEFEASVLPHFQWSDFERDLLGEDRIAELDWRSKHGPIAYILNHINGGMVKLLLDPDLAPGSIVLGDKL